MEGRIYRGFRIFSRKSGYCRLVEPTTQQGKEDMFLAGKNGFTPQQENFYKIPGSPIAYWVSEKMLGAFGDKYLYDYANYNKGLDTGDNNRFLRLWHEVNIKSANILFESPLSKWQPYNKGGSFRKWYGNNEYVINWEGDGKEVCAFSGSNIRNRMRFFSEGITWSSTSSGDFSCRYCFGGFLFDSKGCMAFSKIRTMSFYLMGDMNSKCNNEFLKVMAPTIDYNPGPVSKAPVRIGHTDTVDLIVQHNISLSKTDWDSFETSWDFKKHPLLEYPVVYDVDTQESEGKIELFFDFWKNRCEQQFNQLKSNEEELNRIFIDIYGLQDELTPEVQDKDITLKTNTAYRYKQKKKKAQENEFEQEEEIIEAKEIRDVKFLHDTICELVSYAVGCMFGRYSLDMGGLAYAGGDWDAAKYSSFIPERDNVQPITDAVYFADDIVTRFEEFVKTVYGKDTLEENLDFIANVLGNKGDSARQVIRNYFLKDFYKDHCKVYQKRPIYWLFDSGKADGFKALVYLHRYDCDTVGRVRADYLHKQQGFLENAIEHCEYILSNSQNTRDKADATKKKGKLVKQLAETKLYDQALGHIALQRIPLDLDDGVKINYEKFQGVEVAREGQKTLSIDLLGKI